MLKSALAMALATTFACAAWASDRTPSNPDATVYLVNVEDGQTVSSPVKLVFGLSGMGIAPAGVEWDMTGHHHLIIDRAAYGTAESDDLNAPVPADEHHKHFGGGQTETVIELPPGTHSLQLVLGDMFHVPHDPPIMSDVVTITVK